MTITIRGHFDGRVIVPDEPLDVPVQVPLEVRLTSLEPGRRTANGESIEDRLDRLSRAAGCIAAPVLPAEALRRESIYGDDG